MGVSQAGDGVVEPESSNRTDGLMGVRMRIINLDYSLSQPI